MIIDRNIWTMNRREVASIAARLVTYLQYMENRESRTPIFDAMRHYGENNLLAWSSIARALAGSGIIDPVNLKHTMQGEWIESGRLVARDHPTDKKQTIFVN